MADHQQASQQGVPTEAFVKQVKEALENLYDFPYLQRHPLAQPDRASPEQEIEAGARRLRRSLIAAIEALSPGAEVSAQSPQARIYNLLVLHYVEGRTVQEAAHEIGISQRQAHRNLRQGEEKVAAVLWARQPTNSIQEPRAVQLSSVEEEMARVVPQLRPVDVCALIQRAQEAVKQQAMQRGVTLEDSCPEKPIIISTDPAVAQQILINALSHTIRQTQPGPLQLTAGVDGQQISLKVWFTPEPKYADIPTIGQVITQLADRLGWQVKEEDRSNHTRTITIKMSAHQPTVLVIDDNEGLVKLLDNYLTGQACQVRSALSGPEGLRLAQEIGPNAIVLDVMLPEMDGWEVLQRLKNHPQTVDIPVIMCSVLDSPELAYSLGASLFLPKPVSRDDVLSALSQLGVV
jgi:CheY-like chemotaxis protein/predicted DNA-binding protein (UPF0251 family)